MLPSPGRSYPRPQSVPGILFGAFVALVNTGLEDRETFFQQPLMEHVAGDRILEACPGPRVLGAAGVIVGGRGASGHMEARSSPGSPGSASYIPSQSLPEKPGPCSEASYTGRCCGSALPTTAGGYK